MDIKTPFMIVDVTSDSWARLCWAGNLSAYDQFMGWLIEEGLDPNDMRKIIVFHRDDSAGSSVWAEITSSRGRVTTQQLGQVPPMAVRMIIGTYPGQERTGSSKTDILFKNGQVVDPVPPFPSLSPREIEAARDEEAEVENIQRAQFAYHVFAVAHGNADEFGNPPIPLDQEAPCCQRAWEVTAAAIAAEVRGEQALRQTLTQTAGAAEALGAIAKALDELPERCRYHGTSTEPRGYPYPWTREACCDAGRPAQRRKRAEEALATLQEVLGA